MSCACSRARELAGLVCRPSAARQGLRLRRAAAAPAISSPPSRAPASCISRRATARTISSSAARTASRCRTRSADDGTFNAWVPLFAGLHVYKAADPVCAALDEAGALLARGKLVHSYPHSWRSKAPLIFRATPQWFIRMDGPEDIRGKALAAIARNRISCRTPGPQPHRQHGRGAARLVHQPPARLGRADRGLRRQADRRAAARSGGHRAHRRGLPRGRRRCLVLLAAVALPRQRPRSRRLRAGDATSSMSGSNRGSTHAFVLGGARPALAGRSLSRRLRPASRLVPFLAAGSCRHARPRAVQGGADARLRARRAGPQDVEVARQRRSRRRKSWTNTAPTSCACG